MRRRHRTSQFRRKPPQRMRGAVWHKKEPTSSRQRRSSPVVKWLVGVLLIALLLWLVPSFWLILPHILIVVLIVLIVRFVRRCPSCGKYNARKFSGRQNLETYTKHETREQIIRHRNPQGRLTGTSSTTQTVPVTMSRVKDHYTCKYCGHQWGIGRTVRR